MAEYSYWRERDAEISTLVEQLKAPLVVKILSLLEIVESNTIQVIETFHFTSYE